MPVRRWMRRAGRSASAKGPRPAGSSGARAGCGGGAGRTWTGRSARPSATSSPSTAGWPKPPCSRSSWPSPGLHRRGRSPPLPHQLAPRPPVATVAGLPEARPDVDAASGRYRELLPREGPFGTVDAINGNIPAMLRRGRGYRDHEYLLLKVQKAPASRHLHHTA
jgi:hypothetical protein